MRRNFLAAVLLMAAVAAANSHAQTQGTARAGAEHSTSVGRQGKQLDIASGTRLTAELQGTLDAGRARVGDRVVLKTTEAVRSGGEVVIKKGARLVGHVAGVQKGARGAAESSVTVVFDRLENGPLSAPISLTVDSVTQASTRARAGDDDIGAEAGASSRTSARTSGGNSSGGGLLGGVTNTVGGVAGAATDTVGSTVGTVGGAARGIGQTLGRISVTQSAGVEGGSTLSLSGGNLRLDKGTTFRLTFSQSVHVRNN